MNQKPVTRRGRTVSSFYAVALVLLFLLPLLGGCSSSTAYDADVEYAEAVRDAQAATYEKISYGLTAIVPQNKNLIWENNVPGSRVLVVSWASEKVAKFYLCPPEGCTPGDTCKEGRECPSYKYDNWVTVVPQLKNFFQGIAPDPLRISQLLGLPPYYASRAMYMIEFWASPRDLFRPCPDPEISDSQCEVDFPLDKMRVFDPFQKVYADQACQIGQCGFKDFKEWFDNRKTYLYNSENPFPWTRLGYTYDWGNATNHVGLSEYILHGNRDDGRGIAVSIRSVTPTARYFN
jgi:hypothetical protein